MAQVIDNGGILDGASMPLVMVARKMERDRARLLKALEDLYDDNYGLPLDRRYGEEYL
jgi:hypothetical protein